MFIKRLDKNHFDVFFGTQWDNWTRVRLNHWGVSVVAGNRLTREDKHALNQRLLRK